MFPWQRYDDDEYTGAYDDYTGAYGKQAKDEKPKKAKAKRAPKRATKRATKGGRKTNGE